MSERRPGRAVLRSLSCKTRASRRVPRLDVDAVLKEIGPPPKRSPAPAPAREDLSSYPVAGRMAKVEDYIATLPATPAGRRHKTLINLAQKCLDYALTPNEIERVVLAFNAAQCKPPVDENIVRRDVLSDLESYRQNPVGCALVEDANESLLRTFKKRAKKAKKHKKTRRKNEARASQKNTRKRRKKDVF
jgi:hypothetical protein